jgi:putative ABC transport system permease protein
LSRFKPKSPYGASLKKLSNLTSDFPVQVMNWRQAAGSTASYGFFIQLFFYGGFILIMLAGVLGIVNIMLISLFQRTVEIGTIQTLGATTGFVNRLLSTEYFLVSLAGGESVLSSPVCSFLP